MKINEDTKQVIIFIFIILVMLILIIVTVVLVRNINLLKINPMKLGMDNYGFNYCNCFDNESTMWLIDDKGIKTQSVNFNLPVK